jgi:hypothetical protein
MVALLFRNDDISVSICPNDERRSDSALDIEVLVAMEQPARVCAVQVAVEGADTNMNLVVAVMHHTRRVVRHEHIDARKCDQRRFSLGLLEKVVSFRLVFPDTAETAKSNAVNVVAAKMQVASN